jgi:membrane protease YdiL (CAAX protease family)
MPNNSMEDTPQQTLGTPAVPATPQEKKLLAPVWHTFVLVALMMVNSYFTATHMPRIIDGAGTGSSRARLLQYGLTIAFEFFLLFLVWIGLRLRRVRIREIIGGRWNTPEDFLLDIGIAAGFWVAAAAVLLGLGLLLRLNDPSQVNDIKQRLGSIIPHTALDTALWIGLSATAGFVEEILFRGYLQRQIAAIAGNLWIGLAVSAVIFGAGHGYEGVRRMLLIVVYGAMFGILAHFRKSLRPGMMAHAWHDALAGIILRFFPK